MHTECPGCPTSLFWWTVFFAPESGSEFVTPADVLEEKRSRTEWRVCSVFAAYPVKFFFKYPELWPSYYLVVGETGVLGLL